MINAGDVFQGGAIGGGSQIALEPFYRPIDSTSGGDHQLGELGVDDFEIPGFRLPILLPFEIAHRDPPGIAQNPFRASFTRLLAA